nr:MAG TPA: hypothetical protein [Caudoviricetes sp.]
MRGLRAFHPRGASTANGLFTPFSRMTRLILVIIAVSLPRGLTTVLPPLAFPITRATV